MPSPTSNSYDTLILGGGVAGMSAAIYTTRFSHSTLLISEEFGGMIATTHLVENYPGFPSISGFDLAQNIKKHVESLSVPSANTPASLVQTDSQTPPTYTITCQNNQTYTAPTLIFATGSEHRHLNVKGEKEYYGKGVSYCATCDGPFFKEKAVAVVGGSDSAATQALYLADLASKVYIISRRETLRAEPINLKKILNHPKIEILGKVNTIEILGDDKKMSSIKLDNNQTLPLDGLFIEIGYTPRSDLAEDLGVELNDKKEIITSRYGHTNLPGVFAAGDVTSANFRQAITAASGGVYAANEAHKYLQQLKKT